MLAAYLQLHHRESEHRRCSRARAGRNLVTLPAFDGLFDRFWLHHYNVSSNSMPRAIWSSVCWHWLSQCAVFWSHLKNLPDGSVMKIISPLHWNSVKFLLRIDSVWSPTRKVSFSRVWWRMKSLLKEWNGCHMIFAEEGDLARLHRGHPRQRFVIRGAVDGRFVTRTDGDEIIGTWPSRFKKEVVCIARVYRLF